jgi:polar amino acid transport system substrate-binding protein
VSALEINVNEREDYVMKKRLVSLIVSAAMCAAMLTGCGSSSTSSSSNSSTTAASTQESAEATQSEASGSLLESIKASGKLVVGTASGYAPYEFVDVESQQIIGVDIELAQAIADELGVELEVQDMVFSSLLSSIPAHKIDIAIAGIAPTDERKETMDFSDSYLFATQSILVLKENADKFNTLESFAGEQMAAQKSTTQEALIQEVLTDSTLISLDKVPDCILELKSGKVAGVAVESIVGQQYIIANDDIQFSDATFDRKKESAIAMEKGNEDLLEIINSVIQENIDNGNFDKWVDEYSTKAANN